MNAEQILKILSSQQFLNWYDSRFNSFVFNPKNIERSEIIKDIEEIFDIKPIADCWKPLLMVIDPKDLGDYMDMGEDISGIHLYKHFDTRKYINVDEQGNCYKFNGLVYKPISREDAISYVKG